MACIWKNATLWNTTVQRWVLSNQVLHSICEVMELDTFSSSPAEEEFTEMTNGERQCDLDKSGMTFVDVYVMTICHNFFNYY